MITVTQLQQEAIAAELRKRRQPAPADAHVAWAKRVLADGYQASVTDRVDATRILDAAGLNADDFHGGHEPDSAPAGARDIAAAQLEGERVQADRVSRKAYDDRGADLGPGEGVMPGHPAPEDFRRGYLDGGHGANSPQAGPPRTNPLPNVPHYVLPDMPRAAAIPPESIAALTMRSPSD